jgi:signal peptidase I
MTDSPRTLTENLRHRQSAPRAWRKTIKRLRLVMAAALGLLLVYIIVSYSIYSVPGTHDPEIKRMQSPVRDVNRGDTLVLLKLNLWRQPRLHDLVIYTNPETGEGQPTDLIGRVQGLPGERIQRAGPSMSIGGREALSIGFHIGPGPIQDGDVIPDDHYLVVADTDAVPYHDSRDFGFVHRDNIRHRVGLNLSGTGER